MPNTDIASGPPLWLTKVLIACFGVAVVLMTGWLILMFASTHGGTSADLSAPQEPTTQEANIKSTARIEPGRPVISTARVTPRGLLSDPPAVPDTAREVPVAVDPAPDALPERSAATAAAAPGGAYATSALGGPAAAGIYRNAPNEYGSPPGERTIDPTETVPVPRPRPTFAAIPMPRPRPRIDGSDDVQAAPQERTLFDVLFDRQK